MTQNAVNKMTISLRLDPSLWKEVKVYAAKNDLKISELVEKALKKEIKN